MNKNERSLFGDILTSVENYQAKKYSQRKLEKDLKLLAGELADKEHLLDQHETAIHKQTQKLRQRDALLRS